MIEKRDKEIVVDYDKESDVCYINFYNPPQKADFTNRERDIIFRSKDGKPIGVTILNYSKYKDIICEELIKVFIENKQPLFVLEKKDQKMKDPCKNCPKLKEVPPCNEALYSYNCIREKPLPRHPSPKIMNRRFTI